MQFLPMKTVYDSSLGRGTNYTTLAFQHDALTLDRSFIRHRFGITNRTMFKEIHTAPFDSVLSTEYRRMLNVKRGSVYEGRVGLLERIRATMKDTIAENWTPGGVHAMFHSSGLDSRVISYLLKELHMERGDDWLGTVVFCCSKWEGQVFKAIMEYEGWEPHQYIVAYEGRINPEYYSSSLLDFDGAWEWSGGASPLAVNLYWYPVIAAIENGLLPTDTHIQTWSGQWGNTVFDYGSVTNGALGIDKSTKMFYNSTLCQRPMYSEDHIRPYGAIPLAEVVCSSSIVLGEKLRPILVEYVDPQLAQFHNMNSDGDRHRRIADWIVDQMRADYRSSWYGQNVCPDAKPAHKTTEFQDWCYHWTLASFCEELRRRGIEVR